ncbi:MAG: glycosyltransferase family 4 protein [Solirubrobacteraceae bacterium]
MTIALLTTYLSDYRVPLYRLLAERHRVEVLCYGGGDRYVPPWFADLDSQLDCAAFPARRLQGMSEALALGRGYDAVIAPFAGGAMLPAAYVGAKRFGRPFVFWASVWHQPRSLTHALALPITRHIYRHADSVVAYGEHVRRFVATIRGRDDDVFVAPQAVEPELFARRVGREEVLAFRSRHGLGGGGDGGDGDDGDEGDGGPLVLYVGRLVVEKGIEVLINAWPRVRHDATLVLIGEGPLGAAADALPRVRLLGPLPRAQLAVAYRAAELSLLPSIPTPRFKEPWGLVCNEAMLQERPVVVTTAVGAAAGGLVRDGDTGLVVAPGDPEALARAIDRLLDDAPLRAQLGAAAREAAAAFTYEAMAAAFDRALAAAGIGDRPARAAAAH